METETRDWALVIEDLFPLIIDFGLSLLAAILILVAGWSLANWAARKTRNRALSSARFDATLAPVFAQIVRLLILLITILAVLDQFGIQTASLIAILGAAGLAIGLALQGTLSNIASGIMLLFLRPFKIGDTVEVHGTLGVVDEIGLFSTHLHSFDNISIIIPNTKVWDNKIRNLSAYGRRRLELEFSISYQDDIGKAMDLMREILDSDDRVLSEPEPVIGVSNLGDNSVDIVIRPWTERQNVLKLSFDLRKRVKEMFDEHGIHIPFPQREVNVILPKDTDQGQIGLNPGNS